MKTTGYFHNYRDVEVTMVFTCSLREWLTIVEALKVGLDRSFNADVQEFMNQLISVATRLDDKVEHDK